MPTQPGIIGHHREHGEGGYLLQFKVHSITMPPKRAWQAYY